MSLEDDWAVTNLIKLLNTRFNFGDFSSLLTLCHYHQMDMYIVYCVWSLVAVNWAKLLAAMNFVRIQKVTAKMTHYISAEHFELTFDRDMINLVNLVISWIFTMDFILWINPYGNSLPIKPTDFPYSIRKCRRIFIRHFRSSNFQWITETTIKSPHKCSKYEDYSAGEFLKTAQVTLWSDFVSVSMTI